MSDKSDMSELDKAVDQATTLIIEGLESEAKTHYFPSLVEVLKRVARDRLAYVTSSGEVAALAAEISVGAIRSCESSFFGARGPTQRRLHALASKDLPKEELMPSGKKSGEFLLRIAKAEWSEALGSILVAILKRVTESAAFQERLREIGKPANFSKDPVDTHEIKALKDQLAATQAEVNSLKSRIAELEKRPSPPNPPKLNGTPFVLDVLGNGRCGGYVVAHVAQECKVADLSTELQQAELDRVLKNLKAKAKTHIEASPPPLAITYGILDEAELFKMLEPDSTKHLELQVLRLMLRQEGLDLFLYTTDGKVYDHRPDKCPRGTVFAVYIREFTDEQGVFHAGHYMLLAVKMDDGKLQKVFKGEEAEAAKDAFSHLVSPLVVKWLSEWERLCPVAAKQDRDKNSGNPRKDPPGKEKSGKDKPPVDPVQAEKDKIASSEPAVVLTTSRSYAGKTQFGQASQMMTELVKLKVAGVVKVNMEPESKWIIYAAQGKSNALLKEFRALAAPPFKIEAFTKEAAQPKPAQQAQSQGQNWQTASKGKGNRRPRAQRQQQKKQQQRKQKKHAVAPNSGKQANASQEDLFRSVCRSWLRSKQCKNRGCPFLHFLPK